MANGADAHDAVPRLKVTPGIPRDGGDTVAKFDAVAIQPLTDFQSTCTNFTVIGAMNRALHRARHDFLLTMNRCCMIDNTMAQQRPILHEVRAFDILL